MIRFENLDPRPSELAKTLELIQTWKSAGFKIFGFEVTVPQQAEVLDQNFDPQHSGQNALCSCILEVHRIREQEYKRISPWLMSIEENYIFCTNRADLDSVGAMALFSYGFSESDETIYDQQDSSLEDRIRLINEADIFSKGEWAPRPLFSEGYEQSELGAIARAVADFKIPLSQRVEWMLQWLRDGSEPDNYREQYIKERVQIEELLQSGETKVSVHGNVTVVKSTLRAATSIGYARTPIVLAYNPEMPSKNGSYKKFTICQYGEGYCDLKIILAELQAIEPGWGGSPTIIGSPQESSSTIDNIFDVLNIVQKHVKIDPAAGIKTPAEYVNFSSASEEVKAEYKKYVDQEWEECESYSYASGNNPYAWDCYVGESFNEWMKKETEGVPHKSLWHENLAQKKSATASAVAAGD